MDRQKDDIIQAAVLENFGGSLAEQQIGGAARDIAIDLRPATLD